LLSTEPAAYNRSPPRKTFMGPNTKTILVVDDDEGMRDTLSAILKRDYLVRVAATGEEGLAVLKKEDIDLMLLDVRLPGISGLEVLKIARENYDLVEVIMVSAVTEIEVAVQAMKHGAYHYITKEFDYDGLRSLVRNALQRQDLSRQVISLSAQVADQNDREFIFGPSKAMREIVDLAHKVAKLPATVLILGESGTGKELLARLLHRESGRTPAPFIPVNLAAVPRELLESTLFGHEKGSFTGAHKQQLGKFELAAGGTLFLDEIGDLGLDLQAKLLRAIQEGEIERVGGSRLIKTNFRLVVATNADLEQAVREGKFREDLFYRINVIPMKLPPLRERVEDLPELARFFLSRYSAKFRKRINGISDAALATLREYRWPGNVRELENLMERLVAVCDKDWITEDELPFEYHLARLSSDAKEREDLLQAACDTFERNFILRALERTDWNVSAASRYLGVPLSTLKHKMGRLEIRELAKRLRQA
jgi:DNA-binding NtrC family response regulator